MGLVLMIYIIAIDAEVVSEESYSIKSNESLTDHKKESPLTSEFPAFFVAMRCLLLYMYCWIPFECVYIRQPRSPNKSFSCNTSIITV